MPAVRSCTKAEQVGRVQIISHGVEVRHAGRWERAQKNMALVKGDLVETRSKQRAAITLCDGGHLYLNQGSLVELRERRGAELRRGEVAEKLQARTTHRTQTRRAEARARGGYFDLKEKKGSSIVIVVDGVVQVKNKRGTVQVRSNQETIVPENRAPRKPVTVDAQAAVSWTAPLTERWEVLTAPGLLQGPVRLALDSQGSIYVTDHEISDNRVIKLSPAGKQLAAWRLQGPYEQPVGIAVDTQNTVYIVDVGDQNIQKFTASGQFLAAFGTLGFEPGKFDDPDGLALDRAGNIYITEAGTLPIQKLSPTGAPLAVFGTKGSGPGQFDYPYGLALDAAGNIYVADFSHDRVQKLSPTGHVLAVWGSRGTAPGQFKGPYDVALDTQGNIYVADWGNARIQELSPAGRPIQVLGHLGLSKPGELNGPEGLALDTKGNIYVTDNGNHRVQKLTRTP